MRFLVDCMMKAMRGRIALQSTSCEIIRSLSPFRASFRSELACLRIAFRSRSCEGGPSRGGGLKATVKGNT